MFTWLRSRRREALLRQAFPADWLAILSRDVAHYRVLNESQRSAVRECVQVLVAELHWEGANGLVVTDRMRVVVAAGVALLMLRDRHDYFRRVSSVILYPGAFRRPDPEDVLAPDEGELSGEASDRGPVVLSWPDARDEAADPAMGYHLVAHEFAHQLDYLSGEANGTPPLAGRAEAEAWRAAFEPALARHLAELAAGGESYFSADATDPVEFFADCCEAFFASPSDLLAEEPGVYGVLAAYFGVEPAGWELGAG